LKQELLTQQRQIGKITRPHDKFFKQVFARGDAAKEFLMKYLLPAVVW
jgi:hypothetical protein